MSSFTNIHWQQLLRSAITQNASDLHLTAGQRPFLRYNGQLSAAELPIPDSSQLEGIIFSLLTEQQKETFLKQNELDFAWSYSGRRFRFNIYRQRENLALAGRLIPENIAALSDLGCPIILNELLKKEHGLILVTGRTGSGKTTTLAAFLAAAAQQKSQHIITLEDPVEYLIPTGNSFISQREYGTDFFSFSQALKSALRQDPNILLIGELRDSETIRTALDAASTGHLVLATLHTNSAAETILRLESFFPAEIQHLRTQLAAVLLATVNQRLLPKLGGGRVAAFEVMTSTPAIANLIRNGKCQQLPSAILSGKNYGMSTLANSVDQLLQNNKISAETASLYMGGDL